MVERSMRSFMHTLFRNYFFYISYRTVMQEYLLTCQNKVQLRQKNQRLKSVWIYNSYKLIHVLYKVRLQLKGWSICKAPYYIHLLYTS